MHDKRNKSNKAILKQLKTAFVDKVTNPIRINAKLSEAPASGKSIFAYDPKSRGAEDYGQLVKTIIAETQISTKEVISQAIPISARVQRLMEGRVEFVD